MVEQKEVDILSISQVSHDSEAPSLSFSSCSDGSSPEGPTERKSSKPSKKKSTKKPSSKRNLMGKEPSNKDVKSSKPSRRKSTTDLEVVKPRRRKSTDEEQPKKVKPRRRKSTDSELESKPSRRKSTDKAPKKDKPSKRKSTDKPLKRKSKEETVIDVKEEPAKEEEPDYLDPNFVPTTGEERKKMLIARAKHDAKVEEELHQKQVELARLNAQAELELKKAEFRMSFRQQTSERQVTQRMREKIRRDSIEEDNEHFFADANKMNAQLMDRAVEFKESLEDQERKGMIVIRALDNRGQPANRPPPKPIIGSGAL